MVFAAAFVLCSLATTGGEVEPDFLTRVERSVLQINGKPVNRIEKDSAGNVVRLQLDGMQLSHEDFARLGSIPTLRRLSLRGTNVEDGDLHYLQRLPRLEGLVLTSTRISNFAVDEIVALPALRSVCLGDVLLSPKAVQRLQAQRPKLSIGYSPSRP